MIGVKNTSGEKLVASYDGQEYVFESDEKAVTAIPEDAAHHIFGYGEKDKKRALLRLGWIPNGQNISAALEKLGQFQFLKAEEPKFKEEEPVSTMPRKVAEQAGPENRPLSAGEEEVGRKLAHQEGRDKQFGKR